MFVGQCGVSNCECLSLCLGVGCWGGGEGTLREGKASILERTPRGWGGQTQALKGGKVGVPESKQMEAPGARENMENREQLRTRGEPEGREGGNSSAAVCGSRLRRPAIGPALAFTAPLRLSQSLLFKGEKHQR